MNIDWSKAPEWADAHGLHETGFGIKEFWLGEAQHQKLEHAKSFPYGGGDPSCGSFHNSRRASFSYVTERPTPWTGEGLPPVGTVCEFMKHNSPPAPKGQWNVGEIRYVSDCTVIIAGDKCEHVHHPRNCSFRPVRTPEQIAAEERKAAIDAMYRVFHDSPGLAAQEGIAALYDAGYRKQVEP